jgi:ankyrin repeat protein
MYAALYGDAGAVSRILAAGADVNAGNDNGTSALTLAVNDAEKTRALLQAGANPNHRPDDGRTPLIIAAARVGAAPVVKLLLDAGADPKALSAARDSALRAAASAGEADSMRLLIAGGADLRADAAAALAGSLRNQCRDCTDLVTGSLDARGMSPLLALVARRGDAEALRFLLARGVDVNVRDGAGRTPLMMAAHTDAYSPEVVRLLLENGADPKVRSDDGETAASLAAIRGGPVAALIGVPLRPVARAGPAASPARSAREAVTRALPLLQRTDAAFLEKSGCVSCHHDSLTAHTVKQARAASLPVDETQAAAHARRLPPFLDSWRDSALHGFGIPGAQDTVGYVVWGAAGAGIQSDAATDAMLYYLKGLQLRDGRWRVQTMRPPIESSDIEVTALAMRSLQLLAPPAWRQEYDAAVQGAARWLASATARTTEDRAFQLLGLAWSRADRSLVQERAQELLREQKADGGWSPIAASGMSSDAYATGQVLAALNESGAIGPGHGAYARGVRYLVSTQQADGSWYVGTRAMPVQAYFETGFPHGRDQFISAAATNWAVQALIPAAVREPVPGN